MTEKLTAIVLDITRHNDKNNVVTLYSRTRGRLSFLSPAGGGKAGRLRQARMQPLAVIDADINFRPNSELQRLPSFSLHEVWSDIYFHPVKRMIALFLSEFLNRLLRATMPDEELWDYICNSLRLLDRMQRGLADFHIAFLSSLLPFAGIQPDHRVYRQGYLFDMQSAAFLPPSSILSRHPYLLPPEESHIAALIPRINFFNIRVFRLNRESRARILDRLLAYYSLHFPGSGNLKSLDIIREVFD